MTPREDHHHLRSWLSTQDPSWLADRILHLIPDGSPERAVVDLHRTLLDHHADHTRTLDADRCRTLITRAIVPNAKALHADEYRISIAIMEILVAISAAATNGNWITVREQSACTIDAIDRAYVPRQLGWPLSDN